ncbi:MAG: hypothetical protein LBL94_10685 [Prevotellaceae bacterium]|jgi:hypothetical protein|nr:hypothetical protein [Prevotellaceae bacterium]
MKRIIFVSALLLLAGASAAQPSGGRPYRANPEERQKMMEQNRAKRNAELREALSLSPDVASRVDSVNGKYDLQQQELMKPESRGGERGAMRTQAENIQKAREAEVKSLLTEEQRVKYDKWLADRRQQQQQQQQRRGRGAGY